MESNQRASSIDAAWRFRCGARPTDTRPRLLYGCERVKLLSFLPAFTLFWGRQRPSCSNRPAQPCGLFNSMSISSLERYYSDRSIGRYLVPPLQSPHTRRHRAGDQQARIRNPARFWQRISWQARDPLSSAPFLTPCTGIIMSLHLYTSTSDESGPSRSSAMPATALRLLCAYEDGSVILRRYVRSDRPTSVEGQGWEVLWTSKSHVETSKEILLLGSSIPVAWISNKMISVMAMSVSRSNTFSLTVSADNLIVKYDLISVSCLHSTILLPD